MDQAITPMKWIITAISQSLSQTSMLPRHALERDV